MASKDFLNNNLSTQVIIPAVYSADELSDEIDLAGYNALAVVFNVGNSGDTLSGSVYLELEFQHSLTSGGSYSACADEDVRNTVTGTNTGTIALINAPAEDSRVFVGQYVGNRQFVKVHLNVTGTHTNGIPVGAVAIKFDPQIKPAA